MIIFQQALRGGNTQLLQIGQWAVSGRLLEAADEIAQAHTQAPGRSVEQKGPMKILVQPILCGRNGIIVMLGLQRDYGETGLPGTRRIDQHCLGALHCDVVSAEFLY